MIGHAVELGVLDRHLAIVRLGQECRTDRIDRPVARDDSDEIIDRGKHCGDGGIALGHELLSCRSEPGAIDADVLQAVGDLAATIGRAEHHHAAETLWSVSRDIDARQQPSHGVANEMQATVEALGKAFDGGMNILRQSLDRLASAGVADIQRREAGGLECRLHFLKRSRRPADAMQ